MQRAIAYYRVSTKEQGKKGLGLDAQKMLVEDFAETGRYELIEEFIEIESGRRADRVQLLKALRACKKNKAMLLVAKLDRLSRNNAFIAGLIETKVDFKVAEYPQANKLTLQIMAVIAELERDMISDRTKAALKAAKLRGIVLGHNGQVLAKVNKIKAKRFAREMAPKITAIKAKGIKTIQGICDELNRMKIPTYSNDGSRWHRRTVRMVMIRIEREESLKKSNNQK
jgi:DNA invertase Pin-like site-specific DNA recombinase